MIGLCGAHRTGKTTLARVFAEKHGLAFVETSASAVFKEMGYDPAHTYDFKTRLTVQEEILRRFDVLYAGHPAADSAITDRTPLDMLAYTLAEVDGLRLDVEDEARLRRYIDACIAVTNKRFSVLLVVQPGIEVVSAEGKASLSNGYIEHLNTLILGLTVDERIKAAHFYLPRMMLDLEDRVAAVEYALNRTRKRAEIERDGATAH